MHITLINPRVPKQTFDASFAQLPPLGLLYIAAVLEEQGHTVTVIDAELFCYTPHEVLMHIPVQTKLVGIGGGTFQAQEAYVIAESIRDSNLDCSIIYGGPHACALMYDVFAHCPAIDHVILGPGETPVTALANGEDPRSIVGCLSRGQPPVNSPAFASPLPFSQQPLPARHLVPIRAYSGAGRLPFTQTSMMITRGCPFQCMFCSSTVWGKKWGRRDTEDIIHELKILRDMGFSEIFFQDDTINVDVRWAQELFKAIKKADLSLRYKLCLRVNEKMLPESLIACLAEAGVEHVFFGVESANNLIRNMVSKGITKDEVKRAVALAKKYNIATTLAFIVGLPYETHETVVESMDFVKVLQPHEAGFSVAIPFPGSPLRAWAIEQGYLEDHRFEALQPGKAVMHTDALSCSEIERLRQYAEHDTVAFTARSVITAETLCDHLTATLLDFKCDEAKSTAAPFVALALARASLDIEYGCEPCIWMAQRIIGIQLSDYYTAKAQAMLAFALALFKQVGRVAAYFHAAENAGFPEITAWCREKYKQLGYGEGTLLPVPGKMMIYPSDIPSFNRGLKSLSENEPQIFITGLPETDWVTLSKVTSHFFFNGIDALLSALKAQNEPAERIIWVNGLFAVLSTEEKIFDVLRRCRATSEEKTLWVFYDTFGLSLGDTLRHQPKLTSRERVIELADMAGLIDTTSTDGFILAFSALHGQRIVPSQILILRNAMTDMEHRAHILKTHEKFESILRTSSIDAMQPFHETISALVSDSTYDLILRYDCATAFDIEDLLYVNTRVVDYLNFGQWQRDYAAMLLNAFDMRGEKLLDFGCAYGMHILGFRAVGIDAWGVDVNQSFLEAAPPATKRYLRHFPMDNPSKLLDLFTPYSFSTIIATEVFEHVPHIAKAEYVKIFTHLLAPGGRCVITCPTGEQSFENLFGGGILTDPQHRWLMSERQLHDLFINEGFEDISDDYRKSVRNFSGKYGFSFWRTYCSFDTYFCFKMPGELPPKTPLVRMKGFFIAAWTRLQYSPYYTMIMTWCKRCIKKIIQYLHTLVAGILPPAIKERLKVTPLGMRLRKYLRR